MLSGTTTTTTIPRDSGSEHNVEKKNANTSIQVDAELEETDSTPHKLEASAKDVPERQKHLFSWLLSKDVPAIPLAEERREFPGTKNCSPFSRLLFWWLNPMLATGYKRTLQPEDMPTLNDTQKIDRIYAHFMKSLHKEAEKYGAEKTPESHLTEDELSDAINVNDINWKVLAWALFKTFRFEYSIGVVELNIAILIGAFQPLIQKELINFVDRRGTAQVEEPIGKGIGYSFGVCITVILVGLLHNHYSSRASMVGVKVKAVLTRALLAKYYRLTDKGLHEFTSSKMTTIVAADLGRIGHAILLMPILVCSIPLIIVCTVLLILNIGVVSLVGIGFFTAASIVICLTFKLLVSLRGEIVKTTEARVKLTEELIKDFRIIKLYSWENSYEMRIMFTRQKEMKLVFKLQSLRSILNSLSLALPTMTSVVAFCVLTAVSSNRSAGQIFSSLSLFQALTENFENFPSAISLWADLMMSLKRCALLLSSDEVPIDNFLLKPTPIPERPDLALKLSNASFAWPEFEAKDDKDDDTNTGTDIDNDDNEDAEPSQTNQRESSSQLGSSENEIQEQDGTQFLGLHNLNFEVKKNEFIVVTGQIGSGKSSLLNALSGFMPQTDGVVYRNGELMLCGNNWVQNTTLRKNITFGTPYDYAWYNTVVDACCLNEDFEQFPGKDMTEVGERGVTLSGGQKARVCLARSVYANRDIILLDDIISSVDANVGSVLVEKCINGVLRNKTRILATHKLSILGQADRIIFLDRDGSLDIGTLEDLQERNEAFKNLLVYCKEQEEAKNESRKHRGSDSIEEEKSDNWGLNENETKITREEQRAVNSISLNVYKHYFQYGSGIFGRLYFPLLFLVIAIATFCQIFTNTWLSFWVSDKFEGRSKAFYVGIYIMIGCAYTLFLFFELFLMTYCTTNASKNLYTQATRRLLHVPMSFIDTTPTGRLLNRFTADTDVCDNQILSATQYLLQSLPITVGTVVLCIIYIPWFALAIPVLAFVYTTIASFYQSSSREVTRLSAIQRSITLSHFNEAISGCQTIKEFKSSARFMKQMDSLIDNQNEAEFTSIACTSWIATNVDSLATILSLIICLLCCFEVFDVSSATTGLLLTYVLIVSGLLSYMIREITTVENCMNSVERLDFYATSLEQEAAYEIPENDPPSSWPDKGKITYDHVSMKYRPELPYVLKDISLDIGSNERVGFCGRTGAGKSTFMQCLYRLVEFDGKIIIDGVNIKKLGLHTLRSRLSIIPQDPVLFGGSIRDNLDPFHEKDDDELWDALRRANLITASQLPSVMKQSKSDEDCFKFHLDTWVEDDGANFSLGESQLLALARALVRNTRILILDEATSSVDYETDAKVQNTIATEFRNCTIMCIAHRLRTLLTYDKVAVVDAGRIVELGTPLELFLRENSQFRSMCDESDITREDFESS